MRKSYIFLVLVFLVSCQSKGLVEICFAPEQDCEQVIIHHLETAKEIKCAFYDLESEELEKNLKETDVLIYSKNYQDFGKSIKSKGLMHNKFCVLDKRIVMTGSLNPTENGFRKNNNNLIIIESKNLAKNYLKEFKELRDGKERFQDKKIRLNGFIIENYFCPEDNCKREIINELRSAEKEIRFMTFSFTDEEIVDVLINKSKTITVEGIMEKQRITQKYNVFQSLNNTKVKVVLDKNPYVMHHKVFIIDRKTVITGSFNPTKAANEKNDENILIIHDEKIAEVYLKEFEKLN